MLRLSLLFIIVCIQNARGQSDSIYLWPMAVPGEVKTKLPPVPTTLPDGSIRIIEVTNPFLVVFEPRIRNGKAIIICPGGAYVRLAVHKEGYTVATWLSKLGYTVFVLHYRVPDKRAGALQDLQRSLRQVRSRSKDYGIDPEKVAAMGFSAGAHIVATAGLTPDRPTYPKQDGADSLSAKPDRMIVIYPAYLAEKPNVLSSNLKPGPGTADTFIFQTMDDPLAPNSFVLAAALRNANANVELHMLPEGGHGFGMDPGNAAAETWPKLLETWLIDHL
jgi:acetyl esterase/lipase